MNKYCTLALVVLLFGCGRSPYPGYKKVGDDVHLHLYALGEGEVVPTDSDSVRLGLRMGWFRQGIGELFSTDQVYAVKDLRNGAFVPVLGRLHEGDSISVIAPAGSWPWHVISVPVEGIAPDTGTVQAEIDVMELRTPAMARAANERMRRNDPIGYERRLIAAYIEQAERPYLRWGTSELFHLIEGAVKDTDAVVQGDQITISYRGRRLEDGQVFDDTQLNGEPLSFTYGDKDQVMQGLEIAVHLLREGQEGSFIFPSEYAFGAKGIPGVLDPYMPVEYTVRLEEVQRGAKPRAAR
ncbi:MAG: FKBP-type peptidyl-prolyl cis-trans isomerase [Flavobacteriales bacterium]|nr:FKBP-type peptidyl-prolyl cis-trans isomerase [Flavobacteriales bacterium]HRH70881.1 FKBP-type peptidyl-prolyl cis-trans isomerase [Flavobacteriales bacterium]